MESKTQAQKREDRERRRAEQAAIREREREAHVAAIQKQLKESTGITEPQRTLSKKEQRKLNKEKAVQAQSSEMNLVASSDDASNEPSADNGQNMIPSSSYVNVQQVLNQELESHHAVAANIPDPNHQVYCSGLKPVLTRLEKHLLNCYIKLGAIVATDGDHVDEFQLQFQYAISDTEFRFRAKNKSQMQDITITVQDDVESREKLVREAVEIVLERPSFEPSKARMADKEVPASAYNRAVSAELSLIKRSEQEQRDHARIAREKAVEDEKRIQERARSLASKLPAEEKEAYAKRDDAIVRGVERSKNSMK